MKIDRIVATKVEEYSEPMYVCKKCGEELFECDGQDCEYEFDYGDRVFCCLLKNPEKGVRWRGEHYCSKCNPKKKK